ncbi:hypothetical protein ACFV3E_30040 [Streptomyces sp. NPDC059718]
MSPSLTTRYAVARRAAGAGPDHQLVFVDPVLITLVHLRLQLPHAALAVDWPGRLGHLRGRIRGA